MWGVRGLPRVTFLGPKWAVGSTRLLHTLMILFLEPGRGEGFQPLCRDRAWVRSLLLGFNLITFALNMDSWILILSKERDHGTKEWGGKKVPPPWYKGLERTSQGCASHGPHSDGASEAGAGHRRGPWEVT